MLLTPPILMKFDTQVGPVVKVLKPNFRLVSEIVFQLLHINDKKW